MRGPEKQAIVVRKPDGELETKIEELHLIKERHPILGVPLIRGAVNFLDSMVKGVKALMYSAEFYPEDEEEECSRPSLRLWLEKQAGQRGNDQNRGCSGCHPGHWLVRLPVHPAADLFAAACCKTSSPATSVCNLHRRACCASPSFWPISSSAPSRRTSSGCSAYHGAEHKTIFCYEKGLELTVENVRTHAAAPSPLRHQLPVCGASCVSILCPARVSIRPAGQHPACAWSCKLLLLPVLVGITYEINRYVGRHDNPVTRFCHCPRPVASELHHQRARRLHDRGGHRRPEGRSFRRRRGRTLGELSSDFVRLERQRDMAKTYNDLYLDIRQRLRKAGVEAAQLEARELICRAAGKSQEEFFKDSRLYAPASGGGTGWKQMSSAAWPVSRWPISSASGTFTACP